jgi:hypothetical protein
MLYTLYFVVRVRVSCGGVVAATAKQTTNKNE